jgi:predicted ATPase/DNA-binding CsgD family transcriptional regulator
MVSHDRDEYLLAKSLTRREQEALTYIGEGLTNREIAMQMTVALSTVKWYVRQIYNKLGVNSRKEAITRARKLGFLPDEDQTPGRRHNLPAQTTLFIGREREMVDVKRLLRKSRVVCLTGPGGTGKTRLGLEVAASMAVHYADGVTFVVLASTTNPSLVPHLIAHELEVPEQANRSLVESLIRYLAGKQVLLFMDNFEHLLEAAPLISQLLAAAPRLSVLVTSREALRLSGEHEYNVPPLALPDPSHSSSVSELSAYESVALFAQRARAASHNFRLTDENGQAVAAICRRLDGLPLAIELAAARAKLFSPQQILDRLASPLNYLTSGPRDFPDRQRTLRDTIDWSYNLLDDDEQRLLARLAVFNGGCSLEAVETICGPELRNDVLDGIESLLNKSLINQAVGSNDKHRCAMLETIHEYARERLRGSGEEQLVRNRHLEYFLNIAKEAEPYLQGQEQVIWLDQLEIEHDNMRAALEWARAAEGKAESGLLLAGALATFWSARSYYDEGRQHLSAALSRPEALERTAARAKALGLAGLLAYIQSDYPATRPLLEESLSIYRELGPTGRRGLADSLITLGDMETELGHYETASSLMNEALVIMCELEDERGIARALWQLGQCAVRPGDYEQAVEYFEMALPLLRQSGDKAHIAIAISGLAEVALRQGDYERATLLEEESLALRREIGETWGVAVSLGNFAWIALGQDDLERAVDLLGESLTLRLEIGDIGGSAWCLEKFAEIALIIGGNESSVDLGREYRRATRLYGAAASLRAPLDSVIDLVDQPNYEHHLAILRDKIGDTSFAAAWVEGQAMALEQAATYAMGK